jgi:uncharacterized protein (DUF1330 family)
MNLIIKKENTMDIYYLEPTEESGRELFTRGIQGPVVMLNLIRLNETADYSNHPELKPDTPISGHQAYQKYMQHTQTFLKQSGGELIFFGEAGKYFIGPSDQQWDLVLLVKQKSLNDFLAFTSNPDYLAGIGHRMAAIRDSRLLPIVEQRV